MRKRKVKVPLNKSNLAVSVYQRLNGTVQRRMILDIISIMYEYFWQQLILYKNDVSIHNFGSFVLTKMALRCGDSILIKFIPSKKFKHIVKLKNS